MAGRLVLVVGPSGAGKDTLIAQARAALADDPHYVFPRRVVTRPAMAELEDHDTLSEAEFEHRRAQGGFALDWQAHGLCYGLPASLTDDLAAGRTVVVNTSRHVIGLARERFPDCVVALVTARPEIRAARLAGRGRESADEVEARLRREGAPLPEGTRAETIDNSGSLADGVARFMQVLGR